MIERKRERKFITKRKNLVRDKRKVCQDEDEEVVKPGSGRFH